MIIGPNEISSVVLSIVVRAFLISTNNCCHLLMSLPIFSVSTADVVSHSALYCNHCWVYALAKESFSSIIKNGSASIFLSMSRRVEE